MNLTCLQSNSCFILFKAWSLILYLLKVYLAAYNNRLACFFIGLGWNDFFECFLGDGRPCKITKMLKNTCDLLAKKVEWFGTWTDDSLLNVSRDQCLWHHLAFHGRFNVLRFNDEKRERRTTHKKIRREMHQFLYFSATKLVFVILLTRLLLILQCCLKKKKKLNVKKK
jgi:hypothetical protein